MAASRGKANLLKFDGPKENLLVVEGADDFYAIGHLCHIHDTKRLFRLEEAGGYEPLRDSIDTYLAESDLQRIGFVVDADEDVDGRWASLRDVLRSDLCGYTTVPNSPVVGGAVISEPGRPVVGLWLMPNNSVSGALEEFLASLVPLQDPHWSYAQACVKGLPEP